MVNSGEVEVMARQAMAVNWVAASCMTCILYDHLITFNRECVYMWPSRFSLAKVLFFLNRYVVESMLVFNCLASSRTHPSQTFCVFYLRWLACTTTVSDALVQGILVLRVWALYRRHKLALCIAFFFYLAGVIALSGLTIQDYVGESVLIIDDFDFLPGCYASSVPPIIAGYWIAPVIVESVLFILVVSRAFHWWKSGDSAPRALVLLAKDSTIYFSVIFALLISNLFVFEFGPPFLSSLLVTPSSAAGCILGSRMLLNLRAFIEPTLDEIGADNAHINDIPLCDRRLTLPAIASKSEDERSLNNVSRYSGSELQSRGRWK